ncbi:MAG: amidohydrolase family protein [Clostridiales bacterium]|jgi:predicted TIM-barrel fold metal-dependent hydrolase|nr:amidohydrolase family protein [Clostridiales bacterium]
MTVINAHAHLGYDCVFDEEETESGLLGGHAAYGIAASIVQPFTPRPDIDEVRRYHDRIYALCLSHKNQFFGMASVDPHLGERVYFDEIERCVKKLGFVGIKLHPLAHAALPGSRDGRRCFEAARRYAVPLMVHTGAGIPFADPARLFEAAEEYRDVRIVVAHAGTDLFFTQALLLAKRHENVFLEPSWLNILNLKKALKDIGAKRIMFSSDHTVNLPVELAKYRAAASGEDLAQMLYKTARAVFSLEGRV